MKFPHPISTDLLFSSLLDDYPKLHCSGLGIPLTYGPDDIVFVFKQSELLLLKTEPALLIVDASLDLSDRELKCFVVKNARFLLKNILDIIHSLFFVSKPHSIHPTACLDPSAILGENADIGPGVVIGKGCTLGSHVRLEAGVCLHEDCILEDHVEIGAHTVIYPRVRIGQRTQIYASSVIGMPGFGFEYVDNQWQRLPHLSGVEIGRDCFIGSHVSIAAGVIQPTVVYDNVIIDNQVQIAHHVEIGEGTAIAGCTGIAGSTKIGKYCLIGGAVGIAGHLTIVDRVTITGMTMVTKSIHTAGVYSSGIPVDENKSWKRKMAYLSKLPTLFKDFYQGKKKPYEQHSTDN